MSFKSNFENICAAKGLAPSIVCMKIGLSNAAYSSWTDETNPRKTTLIKIAKYLNVSEQELLTGRKQSNPYQFNNEFVQLFQRLESHEQQAVIDLMKGLLNK